MNPGESLLDIAEEMKDRRSCGCPWLFDGGTCGNCPVNSAQCPFAEYSVRIVLARKREIGIRSDTNNKEVCK